ncbi:hypothetical protein AcV7_007305 [Taiwanofungus camphoratus]|nr:hypothetical protein AcW2_005527 [Antrodia cinnamomea]KAI0953908.1 hypothetical protein AcV7_007305 [Antrodia cinnamomea]
MLTVVLTERADNHHNLDTTVAIMDAPSTSTTALKLEIARLTGVINAHKTGGPPPQSTSSQPTHPRNNVYVNPNYKPPSKSGRQPPLATQSSKLQPPAPNTSQKRDVVIGGVAFESSGRSLVRKDLPKPVSTTAVKAPLRPPASSSRSTYTRNQAGTLVNVNRSYKPKTSRRGRLPIRNMTLNNTRKQYQSVDLSNTEQGVVFTPLFRSRRLPTRRKYSDKPCPRFTTTGAPILSTRESTYKHMPTVVSIYDLLRPGACNRGLTCMYQHDPSKIAICWNFLQGNCPNTAETCPLSHDPTPERTPLCVHFANNGRCTRRNCPFPHVRVGQRQGVCRDFAVLGYCEKGLDCDKQHVRECPDFAEKGECTTKGCKLPHVIRANRNRKPATTGTSASSSRVSGSASDSAGQSVAPLPASSVESGASADVSSSHPVTAEDAQLGDEFISLTFHESESDDESDDEEEDTDEEDNEDEEGLEPPDDTQEG